MKHVEIEWYDANILHGWQSEPDCPLALSKESGWIRHENDEKIVVVRGYSELGCYNSPMAIPKGCIKSIRELRCK